MTKLKASCVDIMGQWSHPCAFLFQEAGFESVQPSLSRNFPHFFVTLHVMQKGKKRTRQGSKAIILWLSVLLGPTSSKMCKNFHLNLPSRCICAMIEMIKAHIVMHSVIFSY